VGLFALAIEVFVLPGFGAAGVLGIVSLFAAMMLAMIGTSPSAADVAQAFMVLGASLAITISVAYTWIRHLPNSGRFAGLFLRGGATQAEGYIAAARRGDLVGQDGVAVTDLRPAGTAQIGVERVDVVTEGEYVPQGRPVRVVRSEGYRHVVRGLQ
jgi:membrane-bound serine protease (ClpP class)